MENLCKACAGVIGQLKYLQIPCSCPKDPWVVVGTTTIDGTLVDVANVLDVSSWPIDWARDAKATIDLFMRAETPWLVGGRRLVAKRSHVNTIDETAIIHCDIVRRQSEIETEGAAKQTVFDEEVAAMEARDYPHGLPRPPCPECGPHGNRGDVLLASSWAKCTTCAGGKPGDLWGEVRSHETSAAHGALSSALIAEGASSEVAQDGVRAFIDALNKPPLFMDTRREALAAQHGQGFKVPTLSEMRGAELDNPRRVLLEPPRAHELRRYLEGDRVVDKWGRRGVVVPFNGNKHWPSGTVCVLMDDGWIGIFGPSEIAGKAGG